MYVFIYILFCVHVYFYCTAAYFYLNFRSMRYIKIDIYYYKKCLRVEGVTQTSSRVDVMFLSLLDGRQGLVSIARQFTHQVITGQLRIEDIVPSHVDSVLQGKQCIHQRCIHIF